MSVEICLTYTEFKKLESRLSLVDCPPSSDQWPEYNCPTDDSILIKRYRGKSGHKFLQDYAPRYSAACAALAREPAARFVRFLPHLHHGRDFIVKPWIIIITPVCSLEPGSVMHDAYLKLQSKLALNIESEELLKLIQTNLSLPLVAYFDYRQDLLVFNELNFATA